MSTQEWVQKASTSVDSETNETFELRKRDHIQISLMDSSQALSQSDFQELELIYDSIPNINFQDIELNTESFGQKCISPFYVSAMTAGHKEAEGINYRIAQACAETGWTMMLGSQRGELIDSSKAGEWKKICSDFPGVSLIGNIGISQIKDLKTEQIETLVRNAKAKAIAVHCNPLQEAIQPEGTTDFSGSLEALRKLCEDMSVPVILKETGSGFSKSSLEKVRDFKLAAIDTSGMGGTHWGRVEGLRSPENSKFRRAAEVFKDFGVPSLQSCQNALQVSSSWQVWASGGVRNGLDAAKLLSLGAERVGLAQPLLRAALDSTAAVVDQMRQIEFELKIAMFCTGSQSINQLKGKYQWKTK